jgi:hypothetical protein
MNIDMNPSLGFVYARWMPEFGLHQERVGCTDWLVESHKTGASR